MTENLTTHSADISADERARLLGQRGGVVWLTGLSGSGKSSIAFALERRLVSEGRYAFVLDGDNVRQGLCSDLGFSPEARDENIRRVGELAALFADSNVIAIASFISPYRAGREGARATVGGHRFVEIHLDVPIEVCERRDPKGLYRKARRKEIPQFTGIGAPYERPETPDLRLDTDAKDITACVEEVMRHLSEHGFLSQLKAI